MSNLINSLIKSNGMFFISLVAHSSIVERSYSISRDKRSNCERILFSAFFCHWDFFLRNNCVLERLFLNLTISYELINSNRILIGADDGNEGFLNFIKRSNRKKVKKIHWQI